MGIHFENGDKNVKLLFCFVKQYQVYTKLMRIE